MRNRIFSFAIALALCIPAVAQKMTIGECVRLATDRYPEIANYGLLDRIKRLDLSNAAKVWLPQGTVAGQVTWQNEVAALPDMLTQILSQQGVGYPGLAKTQYRIGVDVTQQIWDGGMSKADRRSVRSASEVERSSLDVRLYEVEERVEELYFSILLLEHRIAATDKSTALVDSTLQQVRAMYRNGVAMRSDCDQIEARLFALKQQRTRLVATIGSYRRVMEIFTGEPMAARTLVLPEEGLEVAKRTIHPQMRLFDARNSHLLSQQSRVKASVMPHVGAFMSGYYGYPGYDMFKNMQSRDLSFNFMAGIRMSWNFGALYTRKNSLSKILLQQEQVEADRKAFTFNNSIAERECLGRIEALREMMDSDGKIVELRRNVTSAACAQLRNGVLDATSLLQKITDEELAENDFMLHKIELLKAIYNLTHIRNK